MEMPSEVATSLKRILIIDDEPDILEFLAYNLKRNGYEVVTGTDGLSGLSSAYAQAPDIIITDIRMPIMDGIELCKNLKSDPELNKIPVLFLTADDGEYVALLAHQSGADFYLTKPSKIEVIISVVKNLLSREIVN